MIRPFVLDLRSLALMRIGVGLLLLLDLADRARDLADFYTDSGVLPRGLLTQEYWNPAWWSLHLYNGTTAGQGALFLAHAAAALALLLGWRGRIATGVAYVLTLSLQNRNPLLLDGSDRLLLLLLFWGLFLPWEARFSLDARRRPRLAAFPHAISLPGGAAYLCQTCVIYLVAAYWKLHPVWISERSAIYRALEMEQFTKPLGYLLRDFPGLLGVLTLGVLLLEALAPLLLLSGNGRPRGLAVVLLAGLHLGIGLTLDLEAFPLVSVVALLGCCPSAFWDKIASWRHGGNLPTRPAPEAHPGEVSPLAWANSSLTTALVTVFLLAVLIWNGLVIANNRQPPRSTSPLTVLLSATRLTQFWDLFSPVPREVDSRYFLEAYLADGRRIDLLRDGRPLSTASVPLPSAEFKNQRQRVYLSTLEWSVDKDILMRYLRRRAVAWEEQHPEPKVLWTRLWSLRQPTRFFDPARTPQLVDLGAAVAPHAGWQGPPAPTPLLEGRGTP